MLPLMFIFMTNNKKQQCYPFWFFSWRPIKNDSVAPYILFEKDNSVTPFFFFMTTNKKQQCYPLCYFSWRPIKNDSVTPYVSLDKNNSVTPHVSFDKNVSVTPCVFFSWRPKKNNSVTPYGFFHDDQRKTTVSPLMFHLIKTTVLSLMF